MREFINMVTEGRGSLNQKFSKIEPKEGNILFIDGGSAELISGPDFSIYFIRVAGIIFNGRKKIKTKSAEFYSLFRIARENEKLTVKTKILPVRGKLSINEKDFIFHFVQNQLNSFADLTRRVSEIALACDMTENLSENSSIVLDGTLETRYDIEKNAIEKLKQLSREKNINLCALSKTTGMVNGFGESVPFVLKNEGPAERWCCTLAETEFKTCFAKLHPQSDVVLRCDAMPTAVPDIFSYLCFISNDPVFLGYPYGLIEADKIARVSNREKEMLRVELSAKIGKKWLVLEEKERALNAHDILDKIL